MRRRTGTSADCQSWQWKICGTPKNLRGLEHGATEQRVALGVVGIISGGRAVERIAIEIWRILDKIRTHAALAGSRHDGSEAILVVERNRDAAHYRRRIGQLGLAVTRQIDADLMPERGQGAGQSANHVGQSASLGIGNPFGSDECDVHEGGTSRARTIFAARHNAAHLILCVRLLCVRYAHALCARYYEWVSIMNVFRDPGPLL